MAIYVYPKFIRLWHVINALMCLILIFTGITMQYAGVENGFVPFKTSVSLHNICGIILSLNYLLFIIGNLFTSNGKHYRFVLKGSIMRLFKQVRYYTYGLFKHEKAPFPVTTESKFNPIQRFTYIAVMFAFVPFVVFTGIAMLYPGLIFDHIFNVSGLLIFDITHIISGFCISIFLLIHVYFCTIGASPTSNFKSIVNGWHEEH